MKDRRVLLIDNHDSFTFNLVQGLRSLGASVDVRPNDLFAAEELAELAPSHVVVSPGPGRPENAGCTPAVVRALCTGPLAGSIPLLGVCLGHQAIVHVLGGRVVHAKTLMHGKRSSIYHDRRGVLDGLPNPFDAARYHSLVADEASLPECLRLNAYTSDGEVMGVRHRALPVEGVQFHPESVLTPHGERLLRNFLELEPRRAGSPTDSIPTTATSLSARSHA